MEESWMAAHPDEYGWDERLVHVTIRETSSQHLDGTEGERGIYR